MNHDIIAVGASAGGVDVLLRLAAELPADLPASVLIALHTEPSHTSELPSLMSARGRLPASHPLHGEKILAGHIYIAPPDNHIYVREDTMEVVRGPKENGHRPSVDALFRTASTSHGSRVIGVVLSGHQDCGTAGMLSIKARGGVAVVQDPTTAAAPEMPRSVIDHLQVDHVVSPSELPKLLTELAASPAGPASATDAAIDQLEGRAEAKPANLVCPLCQGTLVEIRPGTFQHFRCHVGHTFSLDTLVVEQGESMERALWSAVRALEESASLSRRLSRSQNGEVRSRFAEKAKTHSAEADVIRNFLLYGQPLSAPDAQGA